MEINLFFNKKTFSLYIIFSLLSICFAQESYKSSFCTTAKYYSDIVEKISFSIPNEKSFLEECKLQFLDKNNNDMICYEMTVKLKKEKQDYVIKNCLIVLWGSCLVTIARGSIYNSVFIGIFSTIMLFIIKNIKAFKLNRR